MSETPVHPTYQHRHVDDDGLSMIVGENELGPLVRAGRPLLFGYWRPHAFVELASLVMTDEGATLKGIQGDRKVAASRYDGDPDVLVSEWVKHANDACAMDMDDREAALVRRRVRDSAYRTRHVSGPLKGRDAGKDALAIRMGLQAKGDLVHGIWGEERLVTEVARLTWAEDKTVVLTAVERKLVFQAPVDLDAVVGAWLAFLPSVRQDLEYRESLAEIRSTLRSEADQGTIPSD